ncbi:ATP-binding SpoIIE family protein phosphatase [Actinomadura latina]|uniref:SpoIIE family protein phosphatase n=1 Tax=Actinomadura latina TaxID=163603 RepID=A0A846Z044_9ACTN|nr:ATP-binding SpoIIE family protein phosphatase [Actinomadura latina]NKZ04204.1 SpoIIE family protein phosphatase [Actinomadura latina]
MAALTGDGWTTSPPAGDSLRMRVEEQSAAAGVRRRVTALAERLGFAGERLEQVRLAATEAATNLVAHARQGEMLVRIVRDGGDATLEFVSIDRGPGIADVPVSLLDGYSTRGTLGVGLGSIERLSDRCGLYSLPRAGTVLYARFRPPDATADPGAAGPPFAGLAVPIEGETECGDAYTARLVDGTVYALLCDGLGHGPLAARAAGEAVRTAHETALPAAPAEILRRVRDGMTGTRGGAVAVAAVEPAAGRVRFAGIGNIAGWIIGPERRHGMISVPGIAGTRTGRIHEHTYPLPPGAAVVLHSDGLTSRWSLSDRPGLLGRDPLLVAATLLRDAGVHHDDRSVLAVATSGRG